jgi:hypothetical protein
MDANPSEENTMTAPQHQPPHPGQASTEAGPRPRLLRWAIWVAISALILAAIVCVVWVLVGPENGIIGRAFLTILLLAGFAGIAILETHLAPRRPDWFALTSMIVWVITLLLGAFLVWMPFDGRDYTGGFGRFVSFLAIVLVLQLAVLHLRLFTKAITRHPSAFTRIVGYITIGLVALLAVLLVLPLTFHEFIDFDDLYWRIVVAVTILAAVGTALVPLVNALFAPKRDRPASAPLSPAPGYAAQPQGYAPQLPAGGYAPQGYAQAAPQAHPPVPAPAPPAAQPVAQPWPTFVDGVTPLPVMPDGSPDWNAYYTGYPSVSSQQPGAAQPAAEQQQPPAGFGGYPPPPPLPPQ